MSVIDREEEGWMIGSKSAEQDDDCQRAKSSDNPRGCVGKGVEPHARWGGN